MFRHHLKWHLLGDQCTIYEAGTALEVEERLEEEMDVALLDLSSFQEKGLSMLERMKKIQPLLQVICLVPKGKLQLSIQGMQRGAFDDVLIPFSWAALGNKMKAACDHKLQLREGKKGIWQRFEDHLMAASLAQAGAQDMARDLLSKETRKKKKKKDSQ
jgi:DNA-binding NtrC family response regulator